MNDIVVFLGPSMRVAEAAAILPATYLPPVAAGDVYRAVSSRPRAIAIIDGLFNGRASVWHKEILFALHQGISVFGASSMGALRAAELDQFGMIGIGEVYQGFAIDAVTDDDEVAVSHLGGDDWQPLSVAMVNIRASLAAAVSAGVIDSCIEKRLIALAKARFYPDRSYAALLRDAALDGIGTSVVGALRDWLSNGGAVDQKRADAIALLERLRCLETEPLPPARAFPFERTSYWELLRMSVDGRPELSGIPAGDGAVSDSLVLDELSLDPQGEVTALRGMVQALAERLGEVQAHPFEADALLAVADSVWETLGLTSDADVRAWIDDLELTDEEVRELVRGEAHRQWGSTVARRRAARATLAQLRLSPHYARLRDRATEKQAKLRGAGLEGVTSAIGCTDDELWAWFSARSGNRFRDASDAAEALGFNSPERLRRALVDEFHFVNLPGPMTRTDDG